MGWRDWCFIVVPLLALAAPAGAGQSSGTLTAGVIITGKARARPGVPAQARLRYTWNAAAISVTRAGYGDVQRLSATGELYWFEARREGRRFRVAVSVRTGEIIRIDAA
jgi:hypothetical protein